MRDSRPDRAHLALSIIPCILLTLLPASALAQDDFLRFEAAPCPLPAPADVECGYLVVWEDRADPADGTIRLPIAILPSDTHTRKSLPVLATLLVHANLCTQKRGGWLKQPAHLGSPASRPSAGRTHSLVRRAELAPVGFGRSVLPVR